MASASKLLTLNSGPNASSKSHLSPRSFAPSKWRVQLIPSSSPPAPADCPTSAVIPRSDPIHTGRCYDARQINQYYSPETSEVYDLGGVGDQGFYLKFERIHDHQPTYVGIFLDEVLTDHFYIPPTETWAISKGWQVNPQCIYKYRFIPRQKVSTTNYEVFGRNPRLTGHIIIRFYHLNENEINNLREVYLHKRPTKCRYPHVEKTAYPSVYAVWDQIPTPISSLSTRKLRLPPTLKSISGLPVEVPFLFMYLRYDDAIRKFYGCGLQLQTPYQPKESRGEKRKRAPELKSESEGEQSYTLHTPPRAPKPKPKPKSKPNTSVKHRTASQPSSSTQKQKVISVSMMDRLAAMEDPDPDLESGGEMPQPQFQEPSSTGRVRQYDGGVDTMNRKGKGAVRVDVREDEDSEDEMRRRRRQRKRERERRQQQRQRSQHRVPQPPSTARELLQEESELVDQLTFHMKEIFRILGKEVWNRLLA